MIFKNNLVNKSEFVANFLLSIQGQIYTYMVKYFKILFASRFYPNPQKSFCFTAPIGLNSTHLSL